MINSDVKKKTCCLYLILPCYNEEDVLPTSITHILEKIMELVREEYITTDSKVVFVDDGSKDETWRLIVRAQQSNPYFAGIKLAHNVGHQKALLAGMMFALQQKNMDVVVTMDADLQQDINALEKFIEKYQDGYEVVYGIRNDRDADGVIKRGTASLYYSIQKCLSSGETIKNSADYRLMSRKALIALNEYKETNLYLRGLIPLIGMNSTVVYFDVYKREKGKSKYTLRKMVTLALDGITSFSVKPLRIITVTGVFVFICGIIMILYILVEWVKETTLSGWTSLAVATWFLGSIELIAVGIVGEYIGKIYAETKQRPRYFIESVVIDNNKEEIK